MRSHPLFVPSLGNAPLLIRPLFCCGAGFRRHIREDHHMWDYLRFIIYVWEQDQDDDDGLEL